MLLQINFEDGHLIKNGLKGFYVAKILRLQANP